MLSKFLLTGLLALACNVPVQALPVYSSHLWDTRHPFCETVQNTAQSAVENGLTARFKQAILSNSTFQQLSKNDQLTVFDALVMADKRKSWWWVHDWCMDRLET